MTTNASLEKIKQETQIFFEKLGVKGDIKTEEQEENTIAIDIEMSDPQLFIGERGKTLFDIQRILQAILRKKLGEQLYVSLDINDYKKNKEQYLRELAKTTADEVALLKQAKELPPMPPSDRRIIHMEISLRQDVTSESIGEEPERRVVIKPKR